MRAAVIVGKDQTCTAVSLFSLVIIWQSLSLCNIFPSPLFPSPFAAVRALVRLFYLENFLVDVLISLYRGAVGLFIAAIFGLSVGLITGRSSPCDRLISPALNFLRQLPPVSLIPLMILWFGIGDQAKIISIACASFFPLWLNCHIGFKTVPRNYIWIAQSLSVTKLRLVREILIPAALPYVMVGLRSAAATSFIMLFVSELAGASKGIGYQISVSHLSYQTDKMVAAMFVLAFCGFCVDTLIQAAFNYSFPWLKPNLGTINSNPHDNAKH